MNQYHHKTNASVVSSVQSILQILGISDLDLSMSKSFKILLDNRDGNSLSYNITPYEYGSSRDGVAKGNSLVIPSGGAAEIDGAYGTAIMAASHIDVTVPAPAEGGVAVPDAALIYAVATTPGGNARALKAIRLSSTQIRVFSDGISYVSPVVSSSGLATLVAGTSDLTLDEAPLTTDLFFVEELSAAGGAAASFSAFRKDATDVTLQAHDAAGALVATNTSDVRVHKFPAGSASKDTATGTLVAGVATIALANAVGDVLLVVEEVAGGTAANHFHAVRVDASNVKVLAQKSTGALENASTSTVRVYNMGKVKCAVGTLVAGTKDVLMAVDATDVLSVVEVDAGAGGAANHYSAFRKDADEVTVFAQDVDGALEVTSVGVIKVINHGQPSLETSTIRWAVIRP